MSNSVLVLSLISNKLHHRRFWDLPSVPDPEGGDFFGVEEGEEAVFAYF